jgi:hypothetical protein
MASTGADWVEKLVGAGLEDPGGRVTRIECDDVEVDGLLMGRARIAFTIEDHSRETREVEGKVYLPVALRDDPSLRLPMVVQCGYEVTEEQALGHLRRDRVVATTVSPPEGTLHLGEWSLLRGPNMEIVLTHLVRSLPFVDLTKVAYAGGSAGGYACLLAAAATFPASVVAAGVPPVNLAFMGAVARHNAALHPLDGGGEVTPVAFFADALRQADDRWKQAYGEDPEAPAWLEHSPIGHVDRITCPVAVAVSMNDFLVPIDQFDRELADRMREAKPGGLEMTGEQAGAGLPAVQRRLVDELGDRADVHVMPLPPGFEPMFEVDPTLLAGLPPLALPEVTPTAGSWFITVVDEGDPDFVISHFKFAWEPDLAPVIDRCLEVGVGVEQLTVAKLDQLLDRWAAVEWLSPGFLHLDRPEAERADVERGLRTYCAASPAHADRFTELYRQVPDDRRVLPEELVAQLAPPT